MRLDQHPDFSAIVSAAAEEMRNNGQPKLRDEHVEKDYWVTEVLRLTHEYLGERALFKGGTSLSKGWGVIRRFSEDVDLAVSTHRDGAAMSRGQIRKDLSRLAHRVGDHEGLSYIDQRKVVTEGAREDYYNYAPSIVGLLPPTIKLEVGTRSGHVPNVHRPIQSDVVRFVVANGLNLGQVVLQSEFPMRLMDRRRTFVEKLFAIHSEVERYLGGNRELLTTIRHYYDLHALAQEQDVQEFIGTTAYEDVKLDYKAICDEHFQSAVLPDDLDLRTSRALFPSAEIVEDLRRRYENQIELLCFEESPPNFGQILGVFEGIRARL